MIDPIEITECIICGKPLGGDSRSMNHITCLEHRTCSKCENPVSAREIHLCYDKTENKLQFSIDDIVHVHCNATPIPHEAIMTMSKTEWDELNLVRLAFLPNPDLSVVTDENNSALACPQLIAKMDFEQQMLHLRKMEAYVEALSIQVKMHPKYRKDALEDREKKHAKQAKLEALTSSRPANKPAIDPQEIAIGTFMEMYQIPNRDNALIVMKRRQKAIEQQMELFGMTEPEAREYVNTMMIKSGTLRPRPEGDENPKVN